MTRNILAFFFLFISAHSIAQQNISFDTLSYKYRIDTVYSNSLKETRFIKIYLPDSFHKSGKYPVFFVLDEDWMFEPTVAYVKQLVDAKIIPPSIVVGIHSNNRSNDLRLDLKGEFTENSKKFYQYITDDLISYLKERISKPAFPILIGHSDGAVFSEKALNQSTQPFRAIISLSIQLAPKQFDEISTYTRETFSNYIYHFVASGTKDATYRLQSAMKLDSFFKTVNNPHLRLRVHIYNTDHFGVAARALLDGISFVFEDYAQPNDWDEHYLDSLRHLNSDPVVVIKNYLKKIESIYNIDAKPTDEGLLSVGNAIITNKQQLENYWNYIVQLNGKDKYFNASIAQSYELIKEYDEALKYWKLNLTDTSSFNEAFFYYNRPIELLAFKMNRPKEALKFAEDWKNKKPEYQLYFNYTIAKICADKDLEISKGKKAIQYCIDNYKANRLFTVENAKHLQEKLVK